MFVWWVQDLLAWVRGQHFLQELLSSLLLVERWFQGQLLLLELEQGRLLAISQGAPPPIKGMARASVNQPTTDNNGGMAQPAKI